MAPRFAFVPARWLAADSGLTPAARLTLCVLCQWVNKDSGECFPSVATIASHAALSENTVRMALKALVAAGALLIERRKDEQGDNASNLYTILGYDPPSRKQGGTSAIEVPVPQPLHPPTANDGVEVPQPLNPNVVKETQAVNSGAAAAGPDGPPPRLGYAGPTDLHGRPLPDYAGRRSAPTDEERAGWRKTLRNLGAGPR